MKTVLCYGDSNTYGYNPANGLRYPEDIRWTGRLGRLLGNEYRVIEEGCNGRTTVFDDPEEGWKNGLCYLRPCLNSHKPVDIVVLMIGSNDLKETFHASIGQIADGVAMLVDVVQTFMAEKQGYAPKILLVSPPEIGEGITRSAFSWAFTESAVRRSREFPKAYRKVAEKCGCRFLNAADFVRPSEEDSLHLTPDGHRALSEAICEAISAMG